MELRGVWLTNTGSKVLNSRENIKEAMEFLAETGFNYVFPVVWNKALTMYPSQVMRETFGVEIDPLYQGRDPLAELLEEAKKVGLKVIPWFEYGFATSYNLNGGHLIAKKPEWGAKDQAGNLLNKNGFEWMNALDPQVQDFMLNMVLEVVKNYDIDGVQGDDRMPALPSEGGYDLGTIERYRQMFEKEPPKNPKDSQWVQWRADILTDFLERIYTEVKSLKPEIAISMSPNVYSWGLNEYLQDSKAWVNKQLVDLIHPQLYRRDFGSYKSLIDKVVNEPFMAENLSKLSPGILIKLGGYRISAEDLIRKIEYNRSVGIQGEILFFYEGLRENDGALAKALREGPYGRPASEVARMYEKPKSLPLVSVNKMFPTFSSILNRFFALLHF